MTQPRSAELDPRSRRQRRQAEARSRAESRQRRWLDRRYAVPYDTDGPKVTLGVLWFTAVLGAAVFDVRAMLPVTGAVAVVAALQVAQAWRFQLDLRRPLVAVLAGSIPVAAALGGVFGLGAAVVGATLVAAIEALLSEGRVDARSIRRAELDVRTAVPAGLASGALVALAGIGPGLAISLILLISAYEMGDFIIGTGSSNAVEGPVAGVLSTIVVGSVVLVAQPFGGSDALVLVVAAGLLAPAGQVVASAILPRGAAWAPALRRLDSYLLAAPLWLLLM